MKSVEETASVLREEYVDDIELLNAYDEACEYGVSAIFYTWDEDDSE